MSLLSHFICQTKLQGQGEEKEISPLDEKSRLCGQGGRDLVEAIFGE